MPEVLAKRLFQKNITPRVLPLVINAADSGLSEGANLGIETALRDVELLMRRAKMKNRNIFSLKTQESH